MAGLSNADSWALITLAQPHAIHSVVRSTDLLRPRIRVIGPLAWSVSIAAVSWRFQARSLSELERSGQRQDGFFNLVLRAGRLSPVFLAGLNRATARAT